MKENASLQWTGDNQEAFDAFIEDHMHTFHVGRKIGVGKNVLAVCWSVVSTGTGGGIMKNTICLELPEGYYLVRDNGNYYKSKTPL